MLSEKPDYTRALSADVLGYIFEYVLAAPHKCHADIVDECEPSRCVVCKRMLVLFLGSAQATRLRAVCQRWRTVFLGRVILRGLNQRPMPWCLYPTECLRTEIMRMRDRLQQNKSRMALHVLPQAFVLFPRTADASSDDDNYTFEDVMSSDSDDDSDSFIAPIVYIARPRE